MKYCRWCNVEIHNSNIDECDQCWDVRWVCETNPKVVMKIYNAAQQSVQAEETACSAKYHAALAEKGDTRCGVCGQSL